MNLLPPSLPSNPKARRWTRRLLMNRRMRAPFTRPCGQIAALVGPGIISRMAHYGNVEADKFQSPEVYFPCLIGWARHALVFRWPCSDHHCGGLTPVNAFPHERSARSPGLHHVVDDTTFICWPFVLNDCQDGAALKRVRFETGLLSPVKANSILVQGGKKRGRTTALPYVQLA